MFYINFEGKEMANLFRSSKACPVRFWIICCPREVALGKRQRLLPEELHVLQ